MRSINVKKPRFVDIVGITQLFMLIFYLMLNIVNVGEMGTALPLLVSFFILSTSIFFLQSLNKKITTPYHSVLFFLLLVWIALRVIIDLGDLYYLRQITIGTTGGMLLFYFIGMFSSKALKNVVLGQRKIILVKFFLLISLLATVWVFLNLEGRLLNNVDKYYIEGVDGGYQRPGNFLIIYFIVVSFSYLIIALKLKIESNIRFLFWLLTFTLVFIISLVSSQLFGSNAATANLVAIYLITVVISFLAFNRKIRHAYLANNLMLPMSKKAFKSLVKYALISLGSVVVLGKIILQVTNFDLNQIRLLGFGSGENRSLTSRFDILVNTGVEQLSYSPFFGNINVAYLTTGYAELTLHSFIPNIIAELGIVGLLIVIFLFYYLFRKLIRQARVKTSSNESFEQAIISTWLIFIILFLFIYANLAVGKSWSVMWFVVGFISATSFSNNKNVCSDNTIKQ